MMNIQSIQKVFIVALWTLLFSCNNVDSLTSSDHFIGTWGLNKTGNELLPIKEMTVKITKEDIFYVVDYNSLNKDGKEMKLFDILNKDADTDQMKQMVKNMFRYQLSTDKKVLINVMDPAQLIVYNENEDVIVGNGFLYGAILKKK